MFITTSTEKYLQTLQPTPQNFLHLVPRMQQKTMLDFDAYKSDIARISKEIESILYDYQSPTEEEIKQKGSHYLTLTAYTHFFSSEFGWYVLIGDRKNDIIICYMIGEAEYFVKSLSDIYLQDLLNLTDITCQQIKFTLRKE